MVCRWWRLGAILLLLLTSLAAHAAETLHIIDLRHRTANEILPVIRPLLSPTEGATGSGYQLFIRADDARLRDIERAVSKLDVAPRQLAITVRQTQSLQSQRARDQASGNVIIDKSGVSGDVRYRGERRTDNEQNAHEQMVRVLDGKPAYIRMGQSVPTVQRVLTLTGRGALLTESVTLQDISTGFDVLPRVRGDNVMLEITPRLATPRANDGTFRFQELQTTVNARLGEWIDLGALLSNSSEVHRAILDSARTSNNSSGSVLLKVE